MTPASDGARPVLQSRKPIGQRRCEHERSGPGRSRIRQRLSGDSLMSTRQRGCDQRLPVGASGENLITAGATPTPLSATSHWYTAATNSNIPLSTPSPSTTSQFARLGFRAPRVDVELANESARQTRLIRLNIYLYIEYKDPRFKRVAERSDRISRAVNRSSLRLYSMVAAQLTRSDPASVVRACAVIGSLAR